MCMRPFFNDNPQVHIYNPGARPGTAICISTVTQVSITFFLSELRFTYVTMWSTEYFTTIEQTCMKYRFLKLDNCDVTPLVSYITIPPRPRTTSARIIGRGSSRCPWVPVDYCSGRVWPAIRFLFWFTLVNNKSTMALVLFHNNHMMMMSCVVKALTNYLDNTSLLNLYIPMPRGQYR